MGRDDVQRRHGHRPDVLRRHRAADALRPRRRRAPAPRATPRPCRPRWPPRCSTGRCTRGRSTPSSASPSPTASSARAAAADQLGASRRCSASSAPTARPARSSTSSRSSRRCSAPPPRSASVPCRSAAASRSSAGIGKVGNARARRHHRRADRLLRRSRRSPASPRASSGCRTSTWCSPLALALFVFVVGPTVFILNLIPTTIGAYFQDLARCRRAPTPRAATPWRLAGRLDDLLLGLVDLAGRRSSACSSPASRAAARSASSSPACSSCRASVSLVWFAIFGGAGIDLQRSGTDLAGAGDAEGAAVRHARSTAAGRRSRASSS